MSRKVSVAIGDRYHRWTVIGGPRKTKHGVLMWHVRCDCGSESWVQGAQLKEGRSKSCGCLRKESLSKRMKGNSITREHGESGTKLYTRWSRMMKDGRSSDWSNYAAFRKWALENGYDDSKIIARKKGWSVWTPDTCVVIGKHEAGLRGQAIEHDGRSMTLAQWAKELGLGKSTLYYRIRIAGWPLERALKPEKERKT